MPEFENFKDTMCLHETNIYFAERTKKTLRVLLISHSFFFFLTLVNANPLIVVKLLIHVITYRTQGFFFFFFSEIGI